MSSDDMARGSPALCGGCPLKSGLTWGTLSLAGPLYFTTTGVVSVFSTYRKEAESVGPHTISWRRDRRAKMTTKPTIYRTTYQDWEDVPKTNPIATKMKLAQRTVENVLNGETPGAFLAGPPGVGKGHAVKAAFKKLGITDYEQCNPTSYVDFVRQIGAAQRRRVPLWLDEADVIFRRERMLQVLKIALDVAGTGRYGKTNVGAGTTPIIVCTNNSLDLADIGSWWDKNLVHHALAMFNRSTPINITADRLDLWEYTIYLAQTTNLIREDYKGNGISVPVREDAMDWFTRNIYRLDVVGPRTLKRAADQLARKDKLGADCVKETLDSMLVHTSKAQPPLSPTIARRPPLVVAKPPRAAQRRVSSKKVAEA